MKYRIIRRDKQYYVRYKKFFWWRTWTIPVYDRHGVRTDEIRWHSTSSDAFLAFRAEFRPTEPEEEVVEQGEI